MTGRLSAESQGYVERRRCKDDERVVKINLTESGWELREKAKDIPLQVGGCVALEQDEAQTLYKLLYKLMGSFE